VTEGRLRAWLDAARRRHRHSPPSQHAPIRASSTKYFARIREIEQRIENAGKKRRAARMAADVDAPNLPRPADGIPRNIAANSADVRTSWCSAKTETTRVTSLQTETTTTFAAVPNSAWNT